MLPSGLTKFCPIIGVIDGPSMLTLVFIGFIGVVWVMADPMLVFVGIVADPTLVFIGTVDALAFTSVLAFMVFVGPVMGIIIIVGGPSPLVLAFVWVVGLLLSSFAVDGPSTLALVSVVVKGHATSSRVVVVVGPF